MNRDDALALVRRVCGAVPDVSERPSHGAPTFFVGRKWAFVTLHDDHHGDGRLAIWCAAPTGTRCSSSVPRPRSTYRPPYVGHRSWLGVRLDRDIAEDELAGVVEDAYATVAPPRLLVRAGLVESDQGPVGVDHDRSEWAVQVSELPANPHVFAFKVRTEVRPGGPKPASRSRSSTRTASKAPIRCGARSSRPKRWRTGCASGCGPGIAAPTSEPSSRPRSGSHPRRSSGPSSNRAAKRGSIRRDRVTFERAADGRALLLKPPVARVLALEPAAVSRSVEPVAALGYHALESVLAVLLDRECRDQSPSSRIY